MVHLHSILVAHFNLFLHQSSGRPEKNAIFCQDQKNPNGAFLATNVSYDARKVQCLNLKQHFIRNGENQYSTEMTEKQVEKSGKGGGRYTQYTVDSSFSGFVAY